MEYKYAKSLLAKLARQIKLLSAAIAILLFCNVVLGLLLWHQSGQRDIILIPANLQQKAYMTHRGVSSTYLEAMALMLINDRLNITPENIEVSNYNLLQFVDSKYYADFKKQLALDANTITTGKIASSFYINHVQSNTEKLNVTVGGELKRWVGERLIGSEHKTYRLTFSKNDYLFLLKSFQEINADKEL